jgi:hypothetical protein
LGRWRKRRPAGEGGPTGGAGQPSRGRRSRPSRGRGSRPGHLGPGGERKQAGAPSPAGKGRRPGLPGPLGGSGLAEAADCRPGQGTERRPSRARETGPAEICCYSGLNRFTPVRPRDNPAQVLICRPREALIRPGLLSSSPEEYVPDWEAIFRPRLLLNCLFNIPALVT